MSSEVGKPSGGSEAIRVNGDVSDVQPGTTVLELLQSLDLHPRMVAVERNGDLLGRERYATTRLAAGDRIEIVRFVQGGGEVP